MTTLDYKKADKRGFFSVYKPGQGKYVRWGTVAGAALLILLGAWWLGVLLTSQGQVAQVIGAAIWVAVFALLTFWAVNRPKLAEFLIMTESEMRKVTWPSRRSVIKFTRVVIFMTLLLAAILFAVDEGFRRLFNLMGIL